MPAASVKISPSNASGRPRQQMLDQQDRLAQGLDGAPGLEPERVEPGAAPQPEVGVALAHQVEQGDLAGDLQRVDGVRVEDGRADPGLGEEAGHQQQRPEGRLEQQVVVDADDVEAVAVDEQRERLVFGGRLVRLEGDRSSELRHV